MKKWLIGCLMVLLFAAPPALAAHKKADGSVCNSAGYTVYAGSENKTATQHRMQCQECGEVMWEDHWRPAGENPTCKKKVRCGLCGVNFGSFGPHKFSGATCVAKAICTVCKEEGEIDPNNHDLRPHAAKAATCTEKGWNEYDACSRCSYTTYTEIPALNHNLVPHAAKAPTCTEKGWNEYNTCSRCSYTTYSELPALNHDLVYHAAKAPTCLDIGWNEYNTCSRCSYTTYAELPALNHDLVPHAAKAPTCLDIGWNEYDTCSRCDYITYAELPALGHDYQMTIVEPTCVKNGYTLAICSRCKDTYTDHPEQKLLHRYGEWSPSGDNTHSADCRRDGCKHTDKTNCRNLEFQMKENESLIFCPVCGAVKNGERLERIKKVQTAAVTGKLPAGEAVVRMNGAYLSIAFEYGGELTAPTGQVKITLPAESAELPDGKILTVIAPDGSEMEIPVTTNDKGASFTLDFTDPEIPVMLIRTHSEA